MTTYEDLKKLLKTYMSDEYIDFIDKYYKIALDIYKGKKRLSKEDYIDHAVEVAYILAQYNMDPITIGCALMHEAFTLEIMTKEEVEELFGEETAIILSSVAKISNLKQTFKVNNPEKYRRILVGLADNPSALFIKLADRLDNLRTLHIWPKDHIKYVVDETQNVYIPIAHRLNFKKIKSEMEDLCLRNSGSETYKKIVQKIDASKEELEESLNKMKQEIMNILDSNNIKYEILTRVKSVRGIYNKLASGKKWEDIYDLLGLRILTKRVEECYRVIGLIHAKYTPLPNRFKDYISKPKPNMYQSLHTTVFGEDKRIYEIQIRTYEMDEIAEKGVASHWSYKEKTDGNIKNKFDEILEAFRTQIEMNDIESNMEFFSNIKEELKRSEIYVFTPKGDVIELPSGSTPIDFAYKIHSEVGNTTTGAIVNNKMAKLDTILEDGDLVELITRKGAQPSKRWIKIAKTDNAKSRIKSFFYKKEKEKYINFGKEMLIHECNKRKLDFNEVFTDENVKKLCEELKVDSLNDIFFSISTLKFLPSLIFNKLNVSENEKKKINLITKNENKNGVIIAGKNDILSSLASCCNPVYGEEIVGFITKGYGVKIHSATCPNIKNETERLIEAKWDDNISSNYTVRLKIYLDSDVDILLKIITLASNKNVSINSISLKNNERNYYYNASCRVKNKNDLIIFMDELKNIESVINVERIYS